MNVVVKLVEWTAVFGVIGFVLFLEKLSERVGERREEREAQVREAQRVLARDKAQTARDAAYARAEEQAHAAAEVGQGWAMPSREQCAAAANTGEHDRIFDAEMPEHNLAFAVIADAFNKRSRPPIAADTDPDGTTSW